MKGMKKWISLALSAGLMAGMLCTGALASEGPWGHGGSSSSVTPEDASQGTVAQVGDSVQVTLNDGTVATFTSAHLNGTITFTEFFSGEPETSCQGLSNQIHKKATKKVPEALSCS